MANSDLSYPAEKNCQKCNTVIVPELKDERKYRNLTHTLSACEKWMYNLSTCEMCAALVCRYCRIFYDGNCWDSPVDDGLCSVLCKNCADDPFKECREIRV